MAKRTIFILCQIYLSAIGWSQYNAFAAPPTPEWVLLMSGNQGDILCNKAGIQDTGNSFKSILCKTNIDDSNRDLLKYADSNMDFSSAYVSYSEVEFNCQELRFHLIQDSVFGRPNKLLYKSTKQYPVTQEYEGSTMYNALKRMCEIAGQQIGTARAKDQTSSDQIAKALADAKKMAGLVLPSKLEQTKMQTEKEVFKKKCCTNYDNIDKVFIDFSRVESLPQKDEFETTAQYNERIQPLVVERNNLQNSCLLFLLDTKTGWSQYDADKGIMDFRINYPGSILLKKETKDTEYVGKNSFGVSKSIKKTDESKFTIIPTNNDKIGIVKNNNSTYSIPVGTLTLSVDEARHLKSTYAIIVLVKPVQATESNEGAKLFKHEYFNSTPTIDFPYEIESHDEQLNAMLLGIFVVDTSNGKVINQKTFTDDIKCLDKYELK